MSGENNSVQNAKIGRLRVLRSYIRHPIIATGLIIGTTIFVYEAFNRPRRHEELIAFVEQARGLSSAEEVEQLFSRMSSPVLTLDKLSDSRWMILTPFELTSNSWILYIELANGKLVGLRVRTVDGPHDHPDSAPPDMVVNNPG